MKEARENVLPAMVLIAPLWNWNKQKFELHRMSKRSNRTFMELKWRRRADSATRREVLIAPLWNWNPLTIESSVRTPVVLIAPLWNWNKQKFELHRMSKRSNRTFMELKWRRRADSATRREVLIAPLWNWNPLTIESSVRTPVVLIAPLWNWNECFIYADSPRAVCSNRTFMELKYHSWIKIQVWKFQF